MATKAKKAAPPEPELTKDEKRILAKLGGDLRVFKLFSLAISAYQHLPPGLLNIRAGRSTREVIIKAIESFGFRAVPIPWERFPKRFHKNKPSLQLFKPNLTDAQIEQFFTHLIAAQSPESGRPKRKRVQAKPPDGGAPAKQKHA